LFSSNKKFHTGTVGRSGGNSFERTCQRFGGGKIGKGEKRIYGDFGGTLDEVDML
jgi:hypothetical protein